MEITGTSASLSNRIGSCRDRRGRIIFVLLWEIRDAIVHLSRGRNQGRQLDQRVNRDETRTYRECGAGDAIGHPHRNRGRPVCFIAQPEFATGADAALHENRLAMQRMPGIVNGYLLSVVGRM